MRTRADGGVVADGVPLADQRAMADVHTGSERRALVQHGVGADDDPRPEGQRGVSSTGGGVPEGARPQDHGGVEADDRADHADLVHLTACTAWAISTGSPPARHERSAASRASTTRRPNRPSDRWMPP